MTSPTPRVDAVLPLAVLETVRRLDAPRPDSLDEYHAELATKRLGMSATVAAQIERFRALARNGGTVPAEEVEQLLRLAGRRPDAALVFDEAGRRAAAHAAARVPLPVRWAWRVGGPARTALGRRLAAGVLRRVFGIQLTSDRRRFMLAAPDDLSARSVAGGVACGLYGAAAGALLRRYVAFEGAVVHESCRAQGAPACVWRTLERTEE